MNNNTHAVTHPNARPPERIEQLRTELSKDYHKQITNYFGGDKKKALKFMSAVIYSVQKTPKLLECSKESILNSFMSCAEFQLYPSSVAGEAYVLPYNSKSGLVAQFQLGYQGIITLLWRAAVKVTTMIVRKNDHFRYEEGLNPKLEHSFDPFGPDRGEPIGSVGSPDIFAVVGGRCIGIEVKGPKGRLSDAQDEFGRSLEDAGAVYVVARDLEDAQKVVEWAIRMKRFWEKPKYQH